MSTERIDLLAVLDDARRDLQIAAEYKGMRSAGESAARLIEARAAAAELIERDRAMQKVFDSILRGVNDTSGAMGDRSLRYAPGWLATWGKTLLAAGFSPSHPDAFDIKRAIAILEGMS